MGPANTVRASPTAMSTAVGASMLTGIRPTSGRSSTATFATGSSRPAGAAVDSMPSGASARARQNASVHTRAMTYSVSKLVMTEPATSAHASTDALRCRPAAAPPCR